MAHCQLLVHCLLVHVRGFIVELHLVILKLCEGLHVKLVVGLLLVCELRVQWTMLVYLKVGITPLYSPYRGWIHLVLLMLSREEWLEILILWLQILSS